jgi:NADH:ubiquinone oxidoreductase subunit 4 (subunit M)
MKWLSLLMLLPLAGAAIIAALPKSNEKAAKQAALITTLAVMLICNLWKSMNGFQALELTLLWVLMRLH